MQIKTKHLTIDTNILVNGFKKHSFTHLTILSAIVSTRKTVCVDSGGQIVLEYRRLLGGKEIFEKWYKEATIVSRFKGVLRDCHRTKLTELGCREPSDHVFIAVAIESPDKMLLTEDSDMGKGVKGQEENSRKILAYLTENLRLQVLDAKEALEFIGIKPS